MARQPPPIKEGRVNNFSFLENQLVRYGFSRKQAKEYIKSLENKKN